jgi:1-acyl-sn-glycerol-3-phosphate acyltransferase
MQIVPTRRPPADPRALLPGADPARSLDDWGRSERVDAFVDATVYDVFYHLWFRCEVEGIEHVPAEGGALLVANHSGALPPDAAMIAKAIREEHPRPRALALAVDPAFKGVPGVSVLLPRLGAVPAHPANVQRLLHDERRLVLVFPEGRAGTEKLYKDRYRLRRFGRGGFVAAAIRAGVPIVPVAVVGAEEAMPVLARLPRVGALAVPVYLPAKFTIRFLEPVRTDELGEDAAGDATLVREVAGDVRASIQDTLHDLVGRRRSVWLG